MMGWDEYGCDGGDGGGGITREVDEFERGNSGGA
jgi:hypothetical protein